MVDFGGAVAIVLLSLMQKHPALDRHLVDFDMLALFCLPMLFGAFWGLMIASVFPPWLVVLYAIWVFCKVAYHAVLK
jgi:uncharacterized membrane protein YfcA